MFMKLIAAAAATVVLSGTALAQSNSGFEGGSTTGWAPTPSVFVDAYFGTLSSQAYGSQVNVVEDLTFDVNGVPTSSATYQFTVNSAGAGFGSNFGLLSTGSSSNVGYRVNLLDAPSAAGDVFALQLFSYDYDTAGGFIDSANVKFYTGSTERGTATWTTQSTIDAGSPIGASGWQSYFVPTGTTTIEVSLANGPTDDIGNQPLLALDYAPAAPVPEPESMAMMLAGLGALGFVARRRKTQSV